MSQDELGTRLEMLALRDDLSRMSTRIRRATVWTAVAIAAVSVAGQIWLWGLIQ